MHRFLYAMLLSLLFAVAPVCASDAGSETPVNEVSINEGSASVENSGEVKEAGDAASVENSGEIMEAGGESAEHHEGEFNLNEVINHHLGDAALWNFELAGYDLSITKRVVMMWIASLFLLLIFIPAARSIAKKTHQRPSRFSGMVEVFVDFIRNDVGHASMGHHSRSYEPFLLTLFFFILFCNLLGLIPPLGEVFNTVGSLFGFHIAEGHGLEAPLLAKLWPGITSTGDLSVTATLAIYSFLVIQVSGFVYQGVAYIKNIVPAGVPLAIWPIMWPIEMLGQITKPFALAIRLLANMTAGHMLILVFLGFIFQFKLYSIAFVSVPVTVAIYMLEIFVAFLQSYIFVFLTALFISGSQHRH